MDVCKTSVIVVVAGDADSPRLRATTFTQVVVTKQGGTAQFDCQYDNAVDTDWYRDEDRLSSDNKWVPHRLVNRLTASTDLYLHKGRLVKCTYLLTYL